MLTDKMMTEESDYERRWGATRREEELQEVISVLKIQNNNLTKSTYSFLDCWEREELSMIINSCVKSFLIVVLTLSNAGYQYNCKGPLERVYFYVSLITALAWLCVAIYELRKIYVIKKRRKNKKKDDDDGKNNYQ